MKCQDVDRVLNLYIDDMLEENDKKDVASHINSCERCRRELTELETTINLLGELPEKELPSDFQDRLRSKLQAEVANTRPNKRRVYMTRGAIALAAAAVVAISLKVGMSNELKRDMAEQEKADMGAEEQISGDEAAPEQAMDKADEDKAEALEDSAEKEAEDEQKGAVKPMDEYRSLTEEVVIRVQDVCANPQAIERMAFMHDIEVLEVQEDSIIVEIDTREKRKLFYDELSKLGTVENLGKDEDSSKIKITILSE